MTNDNPKTATVSEIKLESIRDVAVFLNQNMNGRFSPLVWEEALKPKWPTTSSNCGFMLRDSNSNVVGAVCALYSQQTINGKVEQMCNLHSWAVHPEFRKNSILLILAAIRQQGFHFTMLTPNKSGLEIFSYMKFKPLGSSITPLINLPGFMPSSDIAILDSNEYESAVFAERDSQIFSDHSAFPWIHRLVFKHKGQYGFILYRLSRYKRLPSARILFVSNRELFFKCWHCIRSNLLLSRKLFTSTIEQRFLGDNSPLALPEYAGQKTFFFSSSLSAPDIESIYSELIILDL